MNSDWGCDFEKELCRFISAIKCTAFYFKYLYEDFFFPCVGHYPFVEILSHQLNGNPKGSQMCREFYSHHIEVNCKYPLLKKVSDLKTIIKLKENNHL